MQVNVLIMILQAQKLDFAGKLHTKSIVSEALGSDA